MNMDESDYNGLQGRIIYLLSQRSRNACEQEVNQKDGVWRATAHMHLRKRNMPTDNLSNIERDNWIIALDKASSRTVGRFIANETDEELLRKLAIQEAESDNPDRDLLGQLNSRIQEL